MNDTKTFAVAKDSIITVGDGAEMSVSLHRALDRLIAVMVQDGGGECSIELTTGHILRLTLCDFTGCSLCPFCAGTGIDGSEPEEGMVIGDGRDG